MSRTADPSRATDDTPRDRILLTADRLFYSRGLNAVSMDEIRDEAGVSLKAIYGAFPSKTDLITAYVQRRDVRWRDAVERYVTERSADPREQLLLVFDAIDEYLAHPDSTRGCAFQQAFSELSESQTEAVTVVRDHKDRVRNLLIRTARRGKFRRPKELGEQLMLLAEGALVTAAISGDRQVARRAKSAAATLIDSAT